MRPTITTLIAATLLGGLPAQNGTVHGQVVDLFGQPVVGATVASGWTVERSTLTPRDAENSDQQGVVSDEEGRFEFFCGKFPRTLVAYSEDGSLVGSLDVFGAGDPERPTLVLQPGTVVQGRVVSPDLGRPIRWSHVSLGRNMGGQLLWSCTNPQEEFSVRMPPGPLHLHATGTDVHWKSQTYEMPIDATSLDLGDIELEATFLARQRGYPMTEWKVTESRGIALEDATIEHYRGKWLVVGLWSVQGGRSSNLLPELLKLHGASRDRDCLRIVAIHGGNVPSLRELDEQLAKAEDRHFEVAQNPPFPLLLDASQETVQAWEITRYPTLLLIDPTGTLVDSFVGAFAVRELRAETSRLGLHPHDSAMERSLLRSVDPLLNRR